MGRLIAIGLAGLALMMAPAAHAQGIGWLTVDPLDPLPAGEIAVKPGRQIFRVSLRAPYAVRLESGVTLSPDVASRVSFDPAVPFREGQILTSTLKAGGRYCQPIRAQGLGLASACLIDADHDGRFESVLKSGFNSGNVHGIAISNKGEPVGVRYATPIPLTTPIAYTEVDYQSGPRGSGALRWFGRKPKTPGEPTRIGFSIDWSQVEGPYTGAIQATFTGEPLRLDVYGITVDVLGFDEKGALRMKIVSVRGGKSAPFGQRVRNIPLVITI